MDAKTVDVQWLGTITDIKDASLVPQLGYAPFQINLRILLIMHSWETVLKEKAENIWSYVLGLL